jgi:hypothetical protein
MTEEEVVVMMVVEEMGKGMVEEMKEMFQKEELMILHPLKQQLL